MTPESTIASDKQTISLKGQPLKVGIVGGGQLALMLGEAARGLGFELHVLAETADEPVSHLAEAHVILGALDDPEALARLLRKVDCVGFESELINFDALSAALLLADSSEVSVLPTPVAMKLCSNKLDQKAKLRELEVPTASWQAFDEKSAEVDQWLEELSAAFSKGYVLKLAKGGYDGRGNLVCAAGSELASAKAFVDLARSNAVDLYAEDLIPFTCELAVISTRGLDGTLIQYPPVKTRQLNGVCSEVRGPAVRIGLAAATINAALQYAQVIGEGFDLLGTFAVEFFVLKDGSVLVNEIAPRVHNSGHFSIEGASCSQFENHWRALTKKSLSPIQTSPYFGMINLIGPVALTFTADSAFRLDGEGLSTHWYHKKESRPGRKLGHVNVLASTFEELEERMAVAALEINAWYRNLTKEAR